MKSTIHYVTIYKYNIVLQVMVQLVKNQANRLVWRDFLQLRRK